MKDFKMTSKDFALQAMIATVYVVITFALYPISFNSPQIRIAEFMLVLVFFNKKHAFGLLVGCAVVNFLGTMGLVDVVFGTSASALAIYLMLKTPNRLLGFLWPSIVNAIIIGIQLNLLFSLPLFITMSEVFIGEFAATFLLAIFLLKPTLNNETMKRIFS